MEFHPSSTTRTTTNIPNRLEVPNSPSLPPSSSSTPHWPSLSEVDFEPMFEKVVTPSDVGKLNRLVIPKQHAERFFPLDPSSPAATTSSTSTSTTVGGLLLSFEERRSGKPWRFRYSYWNSSQSYVMTKGWSRFVKEKHLSAGDTVSFSRSITDTRRLFIDWRRRPVPPPLPDLTPIIGSVVPTWGGGGMLHYFPGQPPPNIPPPIHPGMYFRSMGPMPQLQVTMLDRGTILESVPVVAHGPSGVLNIEGPRRRPRGLRLFGVDLGDDDDDDHQDQRGRRMSTELQLMPPQAMEEGRRS